MRSSEAFVQTGYGIYLSYLIDYLDQSGTPGQQLISLFDDKDLSEIQIGERLPLPLMAEVFTRVYRNQSLPGFFLGFGAHIPVTAHGSLGLAFLSADTVSTVLDLFARFSDIALPNVRLDLNEDHEQAQISISINTPYRDFNRALIEALMVHIYRSLNFLTQDAFRIDKISFDSEKPGYFDLFSRWLPCDIEFNQNYNAIFLPKHTLDCRVFTANRLNLKLMEMQCDKELKQIYSSSNLLGRLSSIISSNLENDPTIQMVASRIHVSERTLRRRLSEQGTTFRDLLTNVRKDMACHFLKDTSLNIDVISRRLGYQESASFRAAFKKEFGLSPREWRTQAINSN